MPHWKTLHWRGLWHMFARHGDVVDAYIASKFNRGGKRFRFVRFEREDAGSRAMERLHGLSVYGYKILVATAKYSGRPEAQKILEDMKIQGQVFKDASRGKQ
ncbi:hypothetical protein V6N13_061953 [Hibiscus sabdariffa]|uniref:RRM domain-containing protein n=1 Tax=Hibiscus sabdariffa TaxID=183260 RepID=A0ABR2PF30_9ROSI